MEDRIREILLWEKIKLEMFFTTNKEPAARMKVLEKLDNYVKELEISSEMSDEKRNEIAALVKEIEFLTISTMKAKEKLVPKGSGLTTAANAGPWSRESILSKLTSLAQCAGKKFHEIFVDYPKQQISKVLQLKQCESFFDYLQEALFNVDAEVGNEMKKFMIGKNSEEQFCNASLPININITENKNTFHNDKSITYHMNNNKIVNSCLSTPITFSEAMDTS